MNRRERRKQAKAARKARRPSGAPDRADALSEQGVRLAQTGRFAEAEALFRQAIAADPDEASAHNNLGNVVSALGRLDEAVACYIRSLELRPEDARTLNNLGTVLKRKGQLPEAEEAYRTALRINPDEAEILANLGNVLLDLGRIDEAAETQARATVLAPNYAIAWNNLGAARKRQGRYGDAVEALEKALALNSNYGEALSNLGECLKERGEAADALPLYRRAIDLLPGSAGIHANLLLAANAVGGLDPAEVQAEHRQWAARHADSLTPAEPAFTAMPDPERRLRVGYVSPDLRAHSVAYFIEPILEAHDRERVEVHCYASLPSEDGVTDRLRGLADGWRDIRRLGDAQAAEIVRRDGIDILVDLSGHTMDSRLGVLAHRPAPIQVSYLGYPNTTGMASVDYRLVDAETDPEGLTDPYVIERLIRLESGFLCYRPPVDAPEPVTRTTDHSLTFGSCNNLAKVTPAVIALWAEILNRVPNSRLFLKAKALADEGTRQRILARFAENGIAPERLDLMGWLASGSHLSVYDRIDVGLDPFPYCGTTTTCEALWMGVPVVTLAGTTHAGRVGLSLLTRVGLGDLAAESPDDYVDRAVALAADASRRAELRKGLREHMRASPLMDAAGFTRTLETAYRSMWKTWCQGRSAL